MSKLFLNLANISIAASYLVFAILLIRFIFKKSPKWMNVLLWALVGIRLIIPFSFESVFSLIPSAETFEVNMLESPKFTVNTGFEIIDNIVNDYMGDRYFEGVSVAAELKANITGILSVVWLLGILVLLIHAVYSYLRLKRQILTATKYEHDIYMSEFVASPFILGVFMPIIYVPYDISEFDLEYVVSHERVHIRRKDHISKIFAYLLLCVYWFNPIMWLAYTVFCKDIELACDEAVIKNYDDNSRRAYSEALLKFSTDKHSLTACPLAFGEVGVKERIRGIMDYKKPAFWMSVTAMVILIVFSVCFLTDPLAMRLTDIDVWTENILDDSEYIYVVSLDREYIINDEPGIKAALSALNDIRLNKREVSKSLDEDRPMNNIIQLGESVTVCFNEDFSQVWLHNGVKPTYSYRVKNPDYVKEVFFSGYFRDASTDHRFSGEIVTDFGGDTHRFEIRNNMGEYIGIIIDEQNTELIWQDTSIPDNLDRMGITAEDSLWDAVSCGVYVQLTVGEKYEGHEFEWSDAKESYYAHTLTVTKVSDRYFAMDYKPVIYLYPEKETEISVLMDYNGILTCTYPQYDNGWIVTASPDGILTDRYGMQYNYLYWEGISNVQYDFSEGFCVKGEDSAKFLEESLSKIGLNRKEANEFIVYWLAMMQANEYNLISFQGEVYTDNAKLIIDPKPDTLIRVFMAFKPVNEYVEIPPQELTAPRREGFTVIEWGGTVIK